MKRGEILDTAKRIITQDRNNTHGEPENSFPRIAEAWTDYLTRKGMMRPDGAYLKPSDVAEMLAIFKTCRLEQNPNHTDNEVDRIGYYAIAAELRAAERAARKAETDASALAPDRKTKPYLQSVRVDYILDIWDQFPTGYEPGEIVARRLNRTDFDFWEWDGERCVWLPYDPDQEQRAEP